MSNNKFQHASGFTSVDNDIFYIQSVASASAFSLFLRIFRATHGYGVAVKALSGVYLQKTTNLSKNTVTKATKELEELGILLVKRRARLASYYQISVKGVMKAAAEVRKAIAVDLEAADDLSEEVKISEDLIESTEEGVEVEQIDNPEDGFNSFWGVYDKKNSRSECLNMWKKLSNDDKLSIMNHLEKYIPSTPEKQFRKDPLNYLKNKSWNDEVVPRTVVSSAPKQESYTPPPPPVVTSKPVRDDVVKEGSEADRKINEFLRKHGRKVA